MLCLVLVNKYLYIWLFLQIISNTDQNSNTDTCTFVISNSQNFCIHICIWTQSWYPVLRTAQCTLCFTSWQTCSIKHHLNFSGKNPAMLQLMHKGCLYKYSPLSVTREPFTLLSELKQCRVKRLAYSFTRQHNIITQ